MVGTETEEVVDAVVVTLVIVPATPGVAVVTAVMRDAGQGPGVIQGEEETPGERGAGQGEVGMRGVTLEGGGMRGVTLEGGGATQEKSTATLKEKGATLGEGQGQEAGADLNV